MTDFTPIPAMIGGALIGIAAVLLFRVNGRIAGVSGIVHGLVTNANLQSLWRVMFVAGLILGGLLYFLLTGEPIVGDYRPALPLVAVAGLLVGVGPRMANGCTSGHGVCGVARMSVRSIIATVVFVSFGMLTATLAGKVLSP